MATINEIAVADNYTGNAALGGSYVPATVIDTKPLENLSYYTMLYNRQMHEEKRKDTDQKIAAIADLSNISLNDLRGKDKEQATKEYNTLIQQANEYARKTPKNQNERLENELKWQTQLGAFKNNYGSGKTRAVTYYKQLNDINTAITDAKQKEAAIKRLNEKFDSTDIGTPISAMEDFKVTKIDIPEPRTQTIDILATGPNKDVKATASFFNPTANLPLADATVLGIKRTPKQGTPEYEALSDLEKRQADQQSFVDSDNGQLLTGMTEVLNSILPKYKTADGTFDATRFEEENASNLTLMSAYKGLKNLSDYSTTKKQEVSDGIYKDRSFGKQVPVNVDATQFNSGIIDFTKPIAPNQLVLSGMFSKFGGDKVSKTIIETDDALQQQRLGLDWAEFKWRKSKEDKPKDAAAIEVIKDPANLFGKHVERIATRFKSEPNKNFIQVPFASVDPETRVATGLKENQYIEYRRDGSWQVKASKDYTERNPSSVETVDINRTEVPVISYKKGQVISSGTIDGLKKGYIDVVKGGQKDGTNTEGFQQKAEDGFISIWGNGDAQAIFDSFMGKTNTQTQPAPANDNSTSDASLNDAQYYIKYKKAKPKK